MRSSEIVVTGMGVGSAIGQGKADFSSALLDGRHRFDVMKRPGRQLPSLRENEGLPIRSSAFLGAEISSLAIPAAIPENILRTASFSSRVALASVHEAWTEAKVDQIAPDRVGLVVGGTNFQQRELLQVHETYRGRAHFVRPTYGMCFMDTDLCGLCTEAFGIRGPAYTVGGASASGLLAIIKAIQEVESGRTDACVAVGALMDLSYWECQGFRSLGAMGSDRYADKPALACRPFDKDRDGFIYGEACGAVVIESLRSAERPGMAPYALLRGWAIGMDANRNAQPSVEGEVQVIRRALRAAKRSAKDIDYVNLHGTGSVIGDQSELRALRECGLEEAYLNATKSILGHALTAAGAVEVIATVLQMAQGWLHPTRNLDHPIEPYNWVGSKGIHHSIGNALKLSMGFGGMNCALYLEKYA